MTSTNEPAGGSLDGWDDKLTDWSDADRDDAADRAEAGECDCEACTAVTDELARIKANVCIRPRPDGFDPCTQPYDHTGRCDWFAGALKLAVRGSTDVETRLARRLPPDHPDYDAFYDATDDQLAAMIPPPLGGAS